jgi:hypothetical protein
MTSASRASRLTLLVAAAASVMGLAACGDAGGTGTNSDSTTLQGVFAVDSTSGTITLTIASGTLSLVAGPNYAAEAPQASVSVTGTLVISGGSTIALTGTYDTGLHTISVTGGGYTFTGSFASGKLSGTFTTPSSGSGGFTTQSSGDNVQTFCGHFAPDQVGKTGAVFNIVVNSTTGIVSGIGIGGDQVPVTLTGTVSGATVSITFQLTEGPGSATGTISGTSLTGTFMTPDNSGAWTGAKCS